MQRTGDAKYCRKHRKPSRTDLGFMEPLRSDKRQGVLNSDATSTSKGRNDTFQFADSHQLHPPCSRRDRLLSLQALKPFEQPASSHVLPGIRRSSEQRLVQPQSVFGRDPCGVSGLLFSHQAQAHIAHEFRGSKNMTAIAVRELIGCRTQRMRDRSIHFQKRAISGPLVC